MSVLEEAKQAVQGVAQTAMAKAVALAPDSWIPGGKPDPLAERKHGLIGTQISRIDGPAKVQGAAVFAAEAAMAGLAHAALAYSTIARGTIAELDTAAAEAAPGVILVMTHRNCPKLQPIPYFMSEGKAMAGDNLPILQDAEVHWNGQPIALVLAETLEQAEHAASLIVARYAVRPGATRFEAAKPASAQGMFFGAPLNRVVGDAEAALAAAPVKVDQAYATPRHSHNAIEPHAVTLRWEGETLIAEDCTQGVTYTAWSYAHAFGIDEKQVQVSARFVGGGFGAKGMWQHQILAAAAAKLTGRPVRLALSREGVYRVVGGRTCTEQRVAIGAQRDGRFDAIVHTGMVAMTPHNNVPEPFILATMALYSAQSFLLDVRTAPMDMLANTFMRAPGEAVGSFALESAIDELAVALDMDPIELRLRNEPQADPLSGLPHSQRDLAKAYRDGAERFGWSARQAPGTRREGEWLVGIGCATSTYPYHRMPGGAARITLTRDGRAHVESAGHEMGMGTATTLAIVAAERLGLPMDAVTIDYGATSLPGDIMAGGSQQTASIGAGLIAAQAALVAELLKLAGNDSPLAGLTADEVGAADGGLCALADPDRRESYTSILARAARDSVSAEGVASMPLELQHWSMHSTGAMFCEVRVHAVTGEIRVTRFLGSFDCGRILNAKTAASQFRGGIIMGLGAALMEETLFDERTGRVMNPSLSDYHVPVHLDVPEIDVIWTDIPDPHSPMGARGVGEIGIVGVMAAVANAVFNATGKRVRELPITLDKLL